VTGGCSASLPVVESFNSSSQFGPRHESSGGVNDSSRLESSRNRQSSSDGTTSFFQEHSGTAIGVNDSSRRESSRNRQSTTLFFRHHSGTDYVIEYRGVLVSLNETIYLRAQRPSKVDETLKGQQYLQICKESGANGEISCKCAVCFADEKPFYPQYKRLKCEHRKAICAECTEDWFESCVQSGRPPMCPLCREEMQSNEHLVENLTLANNSTD